MLPNILVVDDDIQILETMSLYLKNVANVSTVTGGRQAVEHIKKHPVDIILLDVEMPIVDGFLTLELIRELEAGINVSVIMITGKKDKYTIFNSCVRGIDGYLVKPVSKDMLINKINEVYNAKQSKDNKKTVLLIDDDMSYLKQLNNILRDSYNVVMINSTKLALNYLSKHTPDIILLDYQMPQHTGAEVMNLIHQNNPSVNIPVIILSGMLNRDAFQDCYVHKPVGYLTKPVSKELLIKSINSVFESGKCDTSI